MTAGSAIEVFISYTHEDERLWEKLNKHLRSLEREGLIKPWHDRKITAGSEWAAAIDENLAAADVILLLISADFIESDYCHEIEMARALERDEADEARVIPIILRACDWENSPFSKLNALPKEGRPITSWENEDEAFTDVAKGIRRAIAELTGVPISPDAGRRTQRTVRTPQNLPRSGAVKFVGREQKLKELHEQLQRNERIAITAISGMGGIGKTELAFQYAIAQFQLGNYPGGICWLRARDQEIATQVIRFAQENLDLTPPELAIDGQIRYCWQHWPAGEVLIVIDDVTSYEAVMPYLPPSDPRFKLLVTTRLNLGRSVENFSIKELDRQSAMVMLMGVVKDNERIQSQLQDTEELCLWVGYLPLGLELVGRYLSSEADLSVQGLLEELEETRLEAEALQAVEAGMTAELGVIQALELSWRELTELEQDLACLLGMFAAAPIPWDLVEKCFPGEVNSKALKEARKKGLLHRSLLKRTGSNLYELHQIVQEFFRLKLYQNTKRGESIKTSFCNSLADFSHSLEDQILRAQLNESEEVVVHLEEVGHCWVEYLSDRNLKYPFRVPARFYKSSGLYDLAALWFTNCLQAAKDRFGEVHLDVISSRSNLAEIYRIQGKYDRAETLFLEALGASKNSSLKNDSATASILNNLGLLYHYQGKYKEAEPAYLRALEIRKRLRPKKHSFVATSKHNLGGLYYKKGRYKKAELLVKEALAIRRQIREGDSLPTANSLALLAEIYRDQERYEEAEPLFLEGLRMKTLLAGENHPTTCGIYWNLGEQYQRVGSYQQAEVLYVKALKIAQPTLGPNHPTTQGIQNSLSSLPPVTDE